ncbi:hypothetical protein H4R20_002995, partial [Coemansia guatemalensis]
SVTSLTLWISDTSSINPNRSPDNSIDMEFLRKVVSRMQRLVPRITKLDAHGVCSSPFFQNFYGLLAAAYSGQLGRIVIRNKIKAMPEMQYFGKLTRLVIKINTESICYLPYVCAESLVFLHMKNVPINFTWPTSCQTVVFSNLQDLDLEYDKYNVKNRLIDKEIKSRVQSSNLFFPAIKRLRIRGITGQFPDLLCGKFASDMELVEIEGSKKAIDCVLAGKVPQAQNLVMDATISDDILKANELCAIESLTSSSKINVAVKLNVLRRSAISMLDNIALSRLTELRILPSMDFNKAMDLISRLPRLKYLRICLGQTEESSDNANTSKEVELQTMRVEPISTSLEIISLQFSTFNWVSDDNILAFKRLCLAIPSLSKIHAFQIPKKQIAEFVKQYKHEYPHLATTKIYT